MTHQETGLCGSWRTDFFLAPKYEVLQSNSCLLGCDTVMETRADFILAGFTLSLSCSAPCGTASHDRYRDCEPALLRNYADHPADCNVFKKYNPIKFPQIRPLIFNHNKNL